MCYSPLTPVLHEVALPSSPPGLGGKLAAIRDKVDSSGCSTEMGRGRASGSTLHGVGFLSDVVPMNVDFQMYRGDSGPEQDIIDFGICRGSLLLTVLPRSSRIWSNHSRARIRGMAVVPAYRGAGLQT